MADSRCVEMIRELSNAYGPSGFEDDVLTAARKYLEGLGEIREDHMRNLYLYRKENRGDRPVLMLDAHSDEVGFMIHSVRPNGTLRFVTLGGWNAASLTGTAVRVRNRRGEWIPGVIAAKPVHFMSAAERNGAGIPSVSELSIDIGAVSAREAQEDFAIGIGEPAVPDVRCLWDEKNGLFFGKAFDCRIGAAALIETLRRLEGADLACDVVGVLSSQEEVGERGCTAAVGTVKPDIAVAFEGCPADDTFTEPYAIQTALKKGPMLRYMDVSVICSPRFQRYALELAERRGIPAQASVREGGGNDGKVIQAIAGGCPVIVAGVPVRYIHSANCIAAYQDFESTADLAEALASSLDAEAVARM